MSTAYSADITVDGASVPLEGLIRGLDRAKEIATQIVENRGLRLVATDWRRSKDGTWSTRKELAPAISISLRPARAPFIPGQRRDGSEER